MFRLPKRVRWPARRIVAALSLVGFLAVNVGFPVVEPSGKDLSQPFPCMGSACSCRSAEACWRGCCCHTNREKLAWAKKHGIKPPAYVFAAAASEATAASSCCVAKPAGEATSCCSKGRVAKKSEQRSSWQIAMVSTIAARKCQGLDQLWMILSAAAPLARPVIFSAEPAVADIAPLPADILFTCDHVPPTPPPRA
jgi:hypothetical protein